MLYLVDCEWTEWVAGVCSKTCGEGTRTLTRTVNITADYDGEECVGSFTRVGRCNDQKCEGKSFSRISERSITWWIIRYIIYKYAKNFMFYLRLLKHRAIINILR